MMAPTVDTIPLRLPPSTPAALRARLTAPLVVSPLWYSDARARLDRAFRPKGAGWHHDAIERGAVSLARWEELHTTAGRWGTTTYVLAVWPGGDGHVDGTVLLYGSRWSVGVGEVAPELLEHLDAGLRIPSYDEIVAGSGWGSSTFANDDTYSFVLAMTGAERRNGQLVAVDNVTDAQLQSIAEVGLAMSDLGIPIIGNFGHKQAAHDRKIDPPPGPGRALNDPARHIANLAVQPPTEVPMPIHAYIANGGIAPGSQDPPGWTDAARVGSNGTVVGFVVLSADGGLGWLYGAPDKDRLGAPLTAYGLVDQATEYAYRIVRATRNTAIPAGYCRVEIRKRATPTVAGRIVDVGAPPLAERAASSTIGEIHRQTREDGTPTSNPFRVIGDPS